MESLPRWQTLVQAEELAEALDRDDLVVVDARASLSDPDSARRQWELGHLPGAHFAHLEEDLSDHGLKGGRHPWPDADAFTAKLGRWGISPRHQVVAYDAGDGGLAAARLWFLLRALGHRDVAVLDGGLARWTELGLPTTTDAPPHSSADYPGEFDRERLMDADQVAARLEDDGLLLDARAAERFRGDVEPLDARAGHIPGAVNRPFSENLDDDGRFKPPARLREEFEQLLAGRHPGEAIAMCGSGVTACHQILAMEHAGLKGAKLYPGSWSGWIEDPTRPIATSDP